jgi:hypothetical protein
MMRWFRLLIGKFKDRKPIFGRDWGYEDERKDKVIGYEEREGRISLTDRKTWREILP